MFDNIRYCIKTSEHYNTVFRPFALWLCHEQKQLLDDIFVVQKQPLIHIQYTHPHKHKQEQINRLNKPNTEQRIHKQPMCFPLWIPDDEIAPKTSLCSSSIQSLKFQHWGRYFSPMARESQGSVQGPLERLNPRKESEMGGYCIHGEVGVIYGPMSCAVLLKVNKLLVSFVSLHTSIKPSSHVYPFHSYLFLPGWKQHSLEETCHDVNVS